MSTDYDRLYDLAHPVLRLVLLRTFPNLLPGRTMRETGVEPVNLSVPDPKSDRPSGKAPASEAPNATERHVAPPNASQTTTKSTTSCLVAPSEAVKA